MKEFVFYNRSKLKQYTGTRYRLDKENPVFLEDESKVYAGHVEVISDWSDLDRSKARFVILGIPEDIGVRANMGRPGTSEAWTEFLKSFLNLQACDDMMSSQCVIAGHVDLDDLMSTCQGLDPKDHSDRRVLSDCVAQIDERVTACVKHILAARKIPIIIGGGHNNCYPIIRAFGSIDVVNIDAHTDLRVPIGRHSGNGFSHAIQDGYLNKYVIYGLQSNYVSKPMWDVLNASSTIAYHRYNPMQEMSNIDQYTSLYNHVNASNYGLEIDMDVVADFPSSAQSPVGYSFKELRQILNGITSAAPDFKYVHICEAAPRYGYSNLVGKALATLVNDLIQ